MWYFQDITERKRAEDKLYQSQERYILTTQAAKVGVWEWNQQIGGRRFFSKMDASLLHTLLE
ncbi:hypothetical protein C7B82_30280 [Stenomitos frigidus ULC18]|uniref:PAC domain-containing protein n=1 Tax=Stenomitos frigidus ULC18 TaxID=2107698 RepID=A0A2T1DT60_9CYAN|nr:hypothetical protein C7B82_30280 [Stenomitos frigidus ULC18]